MNLFDIAEEPASVAERLIEEDPVHAHLQGLLILYVWRSEAAVSNGRVKLGKVRKVGGVSAFLIRQALRDDRPPLGTAAWRQWREEANLPLFVVEFARDEWTYLDTDQQVALVDHELCHLDGDIDNPSGIAIVGHDVEEFYGVIRRRGLWTPDVARMGELAAEQLSLLSDGAARFLRDQDGDQDAA